MAWEDRRGEYAFDFGELDRRVKHVGLRCGTGLQAAVFVELGQDAVHAVVTQASRVVSGGDKPLLRVYIRSNGVVLAVSPKS
jgi:hypothetical protein